MNITLEQLKEIIGDKECQIIMLMKENAQLRKRLAELTPKKEEKE